MIARKLHVYAVTVPVNDAWGMNRNLPRARDLMPQADPYIVGLIRKLRREVRADRAASKSSQIMGTSMFTPRFEAPPPQGELPYDFELPRQDDDLWPLLRDGEKTKTDGNLGVV